MRNELRKFNLTHTFLLAPLARCLHVAARMRLLTQARQILTPPSQALETEQSCTCFGRHQLRAEELLLRLILFELDGQLQDLCVVPLKG